MFLMEVGIACVVLLTIVLLAPRAGLVVGPLLLVLGIVPIFALIFVPAASRPRIEEHYGMLATFAFLVLAPSGLLMTILGYFMRDR
jgi:hypothetical protein